MIIDIYPDCPRPSWLKKGMEVHCVGEAYDVYVVDQIGEKAAFLVTRKKRAHGWESFTKLWRPGHPEDMKRN